MSERDIQLKKLSCIAFSMHDLRLFLDTHPDSTEAMEKLNDLEKIFKPLKEKFEKKFGPLKISNADNAVEWIKGPWPWEVN
ncbi:MAG: spore coat protein CotJB [Ruminococcus sp.]|nr:spore coat protein CotJB [Ruminococcus sp.]